jgi:hypothetical protein
LPASHCHNWFPHTWNSIGWQQAGVPLIQLKQKRHPLSVVLPALLATDGRRGLRAGLELGAGLEHCLCCDFDSGLRSIEEGYSPI